MIISLVPLEPLRLSGRAAVALILDLVLAGCFDAEAPAVSPNQAQAPAEGRPEARSPDPGAPGRGETPDVPGGKACILGKVRFSGQPPPRQPIRMDSDATCASLHPGPVDPEDFVLNEDRTLRNVFVYISSGLEGKRFPVPELPVELDQSKCRFVPHVFGLQTRQKLKVKNSDGTYHNVHAFSRKGQEFNQGMPAGSLELVKTFPRPEVMVKFKCEVHPWMGAYCGILEHPFFSVTDGEGEFEISDLPPGAYRITAWHEKLGELEKEVELAANERRTIDFLYEE